MIIEKKVQELKHYPFVAEHVSCYITVTTLSAKCHIVIELKENEKSNGGERLPPPDQRDREAESR